MQRNTGSNKRGFTFIELMVSLALGMLVVGSAIKLFSQGVDATWVVSQRAELQQDLRAVQIMLQKDISMAGAGLPSGQGVALASGTGTSPIYGCDQTGTAAGCPPNGGPKYPCSSLTGTCIPTLYGIIPGYQLGITPPGSTVKTDLITVTYSDPLLMINCYQVAVTSATSATFTGPPAPGPPPSTWTPTCSLPASLTLPQSLNDPVVGLQPGDLILFQGKIVNTVYAVGEVTKVTGSYPTFTVTFASGDALKMNQPGANNDLSLFAPGVPAGNPGSPVASNVANRLEVITYYLKNIADPSGATTGITVLYRQINGQTAVPLSDNVINMQFTYDTYDTSGDLLNQTGDGGESLGVSLNLIRKINIAHLTIRSQSAGTRTSLMATQGYQGYDIQTSISARNLSYQNRYPTN